MKQHDSMDESVPRPRVIRYLLMHVYKSIEENLKLHDRWLKLLQKHSFTVNKVLPRNYSDHSAILERRNIPALTKMLAQECASKWDQICTALNLPESVRHDLNVKQMTSGAIPCFTHLLTEWVLGGYEHAKPSTLENLKEALRSPLVERGAQAKLLQNFHCLSDQKSTSPDAQPLEITRQCYDTVVSEGKSTLLEVQAVTSEDDAVCYEWKKDDSPFEMGLHKSIICISNANHLAEGVYQCIVNIHGSSLPSIEAKTISLKVKVLPAKQELIDKYLAKPKIPKDSWPPERSNTYINLALIKQGKFDMASEYARSTIQGSVDDVLADKESIDYETIFTDLKSAVRLLIEGRPGSGKTTLVHKLSQDWARENPVLNLQNIKFLFLVHLRGFFNAPFQFRDIVQLYYSSQSTVDQVVQEAEGKNGEGICIILDGLDEYQPDSMKQTFVYRLIMKEVLTNSIVIVTSRPAASYQFRSAASKQVEVIGFLREEIFNYIEKYPFWQAGKESNLLLYLNNHPNVLHMCYLPIHAAMVCYLFDVMGNALPQTETEMYKEFTNLTLLRSLTRNDRKAEILYETFESVEDLPDVEKKVFLEICELSYKKTVSSKQVMTRAEVKRFLSDVNSGSESLGLITVDRMSRKYGFHNVYTFLHLTFQEYLAAYHLYKLKDQLEAIQEHCWTEHMEVVLKFFCGLTHFDKKDVRLAKILSDRTDSLIGVQCAFESQQSVVCDYVVESGEHGTLSFKGHFLTPSDLTAIGYVIKTATCPVEKLVLNFCTLDQEGVNAFIEKAGEKVLSVKTLCYRGGLEQYKMLHLCLEKLISIETLDLSGTTPTKSKIDCLTQNNITLPDLHTLKLSSSTGPSYVDQTTLQRMHFNSPKFQRIFIDTYCYQCTEIFFSNCHLYESSKQEIVNLSIADVANFKIVSEGLKQGRCTALTLIDSVLRGDNVNFLTAGLEYCRRLQRLELNKCTIEEAMCYAFAECLGQCHNLKVLNVIGCGIGGRILFTECLQHCSGLEEVSLVYNDISDDNAKALAENLQHCSDLKILNLHNNHISSIDVMALAKCLQNFNCLLALNISFNIIGQDCAEALAQSLRHCRNLQTLSLSSEYIVAKKRIERLLHPVDIKWTTFPSWH